MTLRRTKPKYPTAAQLEERRAWAESFDHCWICGARSDLQVHEIASRARAPKKWADMRCYFRACGYCNTHVLNNLPEEVQLAFKRHFDFENYDRVAVNRMRGRADDSISDGDVRGWQDFVSRISDKFHPTVKAVSR